MADINNSTPSRARNAHIFAREDHEHYVDPCWCSERLFQEEKFFGSVHDPCCGWGRIPEAAIAAGLVATAADIVDRGYEPARLCNFLEDDTSYQNIVCNPPFKGALPEKFARQALRLAKCKVAMIFLVARLNAAHWLQELPLRRVLLLTPRPSMPPGSHIAAGGKVGGGVPDFCWLVFECGYEGSPELGWLHRDGHHTRAHRREVKYSCCKTSSGTALGVSRNTSHFVGQFLWATAVTLLPLATVFAIEFTAPAHPALLSAVFLRERLTPSRIGVVIFGFLGDLVILRPGLESFEPAAFLPLAAAFAFAVVLTQTKALIATETWFTILLWMNVIQLPLALLGSSSWSYLALGAADLLPVGAVAVMGFTSQFCLAQAFRHGDATVVVPLDFIRVPLITVVGWRLYDKRLDTFMFLGVGGIVFSVLWNLRTEAVRKAGNA